MYRLAILSTWRNPLITPLDNPLCTRVPLTYLESLLSVWYDPCPPWSQVACKLTSPNPFPPHSLFLPPTVPQFNYAPFYDDITTPTSQDYSWTLNFQKKFSIEFIQYKAVIFLADNKSHSNYITTELEAEKTSVSLE
jgi:hypothetical protein